MKNEGVALHNPVHGGLYQRGIQGQWRALHRKEIGAQGAEQGITEVAVTVVKVAKAYCRECGVEVWVRVRNVIGKHPIKAVCKSCEADDNAVFE